MTGLFVNVYIRMRVIHIRLVKRNVNDMRIVHQTRLVVITGVLTHATHFAVLMLSARFTITFQRVPVPRAILGIPSSTATLNQRIHVRRLKLNLN